MPAPKTIAFIGDIHCGSRCGLWPEEDIPKRCHTGARYLMECYRDMVAQWPDIDLLFLMGDLIDGKQRKADGVGLFTADLGEQVRGAIDVLQPLADKCQKIYRVEGTPYHEDFHNALGELDKALDVSRSQQIFDVDLGSGILNVAHHPAGGGALYMGTKVDKEAVWAKFATGCGKVPNARWIVRAHCHSYMFQDTETSTVLQTPCWQLPTAWAKKQNYYRFQADLGGVLMIADDAEDAGYRFRKTLYPSPQPEIIRETEASKPAANRKGAKGARRKRVRA